MAPSRQDDWSLKVHLWLSSKLSKEPLFSTFPIALPPPLCPAQDSLLASQPSWKLFGALFLPWKLSAIRLCSLRAASSQDKLIYLRTGVLQLALKRGFWGQWRLCAISVWCVHFLERGHRFHQTLKYVHDPQKCWSHCWRISIAHNHRRSSSGIMFAFLPQCERESAIW